MHHLKTHPVALFLAEPMTARNYISSLYEKIGAANRADAIAKLRDCLS